MGKNNDVEVVTGYRYQMGVHLIPTVGPVDSVNRIVIGEREAWVGPVTDNTTITINKPELFGGDSREGGVIGDVDILMGAATQPRNSYLATHQGSNCSAYRGVLSLVFKRFQWASGNPYFKSPWVEVTRILKGWGSAGVWNEDDAKIGTLDMNPAHIVYQCLTQPWGMGYSPTELDDTSFRSVATTLKNENFGMSVEWSEQSSIEAFVGDVLDHINGALGVDLGTGKIKIKLIRDDYVIGELLELNESNIIDIKSFQRSAYGDAANEVVVTYTDRDQADKTIAVQNPASIAAQGGIVSVTRNYPGIRTAELASRVAMRDLKTLSTPLAKATVITNRALWSHSKGDVVKLVWPKEGISGVPFRIIDIDKGNLHNSEITAVMVEDVFGLPSASYAMAPDTKWVDTVVAPLPADAAKVVEAPYWEVVRSISPAERATLQPDYGFGLMMASRGAVRSSLNFILASSPNNTTYTDGRIGHFSPAGSLSTPVNQTAESVTLTGATDLDSVILSADGGYAYLDDECVAITAVNPSTGVVSIKRGILDTVPTAHISGTKMWFHVPGKPAFDRTERVFGETVYYKPRPVSGAGVLQLDDAAVETLVFSNRASRPYPPGRFQIDGAYYPSNVSGPSFTVTWAHRDRDAQTVGFDDYLTGSIGPEVGVTYRLRLFNGAALLRTYDMDGTTTSWSYPAADDNADGNPATLRVELCSVRDGLESLQSHSWSIGRTSATGSIVVGGIPAAPILSATDASFAVSLSWTLGDARTDMSKFEVRSSVTPDFAHSEVLQYVNYPTLTFLHNMGVANSYRWYWVRVVDSAGVMSPWSNMVSGRGVTAAMSPSQMLSDINDLLTNGSGTSKIEMLADRFSVVAPDGTKTPFAVVETTPGVWKTLLNSDVLIGGNVDIANLTTGSLASDVMLKLGGGTIELDGAGEIRVLKDMGVTPDFVRLTSGEIRFLRYIDGAYQSYNYLSRIEAGIANNNDTVQIPGYWKAQPRVIVSPASLGLYKASASGQDQSIECQAVGITETSTGSGKWRFTARATLNIAAGSSVTAVNTTSGDLTSSTTYSTGTYITPANCSSITPTVNLTSFRSVNGTTCQQRAVNWRVRYSGDGGGGAWRNKAIGAVVTAVTDSYTFNFPSAGTYSFWLEFSAVDVAGTFVATGLPAESSSTTLNSPGTTAQSDTRLTINMPAYSPPSGWVIHSVNWSYQVGWYIMGGFQFADGFGRVFGPPGPNNTINNNGGSSASYMPVSTYNSTTSTYNNSQCWVDAYDTKGGSWGGGSAVYTGYPSAVASATINLRRYAGYSASGQNRFDFAAYGYSLASASVLATGTLNWLAIGE